MKKTILSILILFSTFLFAQNQERISVHYFDIPSDKEAVFMKWTKEVNLILENEGFGKDFYKVYKVKCDDKADKFRYFRKKENPVNLSCMIYENTFKKFYQKI